MLTKFDDRPTLSNRAVQIWQILVGMADTRRTTTYGELADMLGYGGAGVLGRQLGHIMFLCDQADIPPLTVLVVNAESGLPGEGLETKRDLHELREEVFNFDWFAYCPPSASEFERAWDEAKDNQWRIRA